MENFKFWHSLHGYIIVFMFLTTASTGSTCEAPSRPQCFRRKADETIYICEWSMNTNDSNIAYVLHFDYGNSTEKIFGSFEKTWCELSEERLIQYRPVDIWVEAHTNNSSCKSTRTSVVLLHTVKYKAPQNIAISWSKNNLNLSWTAVEEFPALAEVRFRRDGPPREPWENRVTNTSTKYHITVVNLLRQTAYQVQIRHRSVQADNSLWSDWSSPVIIPAELEQPKACMTTSLINGTRQVVLTWEPPPHAAAVTGVSYSVWDTQSSHGCPCKKRLRHTELNKHTTYVSYSAVNISVTARNAAGDSPQAVIPVLPVSTAGLKICDKTLLQEKVKKKTCLELYELQDGDSRPRKVITITTRKHADEPMKDYIRYLYFEHRCERGRPQTFKMCLFYHKEGVPLTEPQDFSFLGETHSSVNLTWKAIPSENQRGFLTYYRLCMMKISSQDEPKECHNISASVTNHYLENLTPGSKYNMSLAGVTRAGKGPNAIIIINTHPEIFGKVLPLGLSSLFVLLLMSTTCTCVLTRIKKKLLPPVPTPIIPHFSHYQPQSQRLERMEEVDELSLHQLHPDGKTAPEGPEETTAFRGEWDDGADGDVESESGDSSGERLSSADEALRSSKGAEMTELEQVDNDIAMLIYRNGLIFDVKTDSP